MSGRIKWAKPWEQITPKILVVCHKCLFLIPDACPVQTGYILSHTIFTLGLRVTKKAFLYIGIYAGKESDTVHSFVMLLPENATGQSSYEE